MTAVEWLESIFYSESKTVAFEKWVILEEEMDRIIEKAKEMEKQQIVKAVNVGFDEGCKFPEDIKLGSAEQYYNEIYGK